MYSDKPKDIHSPVQRGFWWSHVGWVICKRYETTNFSLVRDFERFPEILWLNRYHYLVSVIYAVICFGVGSVLGRATGISAYTGWSFLVWGYFLSTVLVYHGTFCINSLAHVWGTKRFAVPDESRNNFFLAIVTMGEGWHNNHHRFPTSVRQGLRWWEIDLSHLILRVLRRARLVKNLKRPTAHEVASAQTAH